jgi:HD superfamily phosphohydrolase YqeK
LPFLSSLLTPSRIQHSLGSARDLSTEYQLALLEEAGIELHAPCERHPVYLHALVGAHLVAKELGITDRLILDAIAAHSYAGRGHNMDAPLSQCLRFADILAPIQEWKGMKKLRSAVYARRTDKAALLQCGWLIEYFQEQRVPVHPNLARQYQALLGRLAVTESFFDRW